jgi:hypothetical protein
MRPAKVLKWVGGYLVLNVVAVASVLIGGLWSRTLVGWCLIAALSLPIWALGEWVGDAVFSEKLSKRIDPSPDRVSGTRIGYILLVMLLEIGVVLGIWWLVGPWLENQLEVWRP